MGKGISTHIGQFLLNMPFFVIASDIEPASIGIIALYLYLYNELDDDFKDGISVSAIVVRIYSQQPSRQVPHHSR